jgi:hypothetical protein
MKKIQLIIFMLAVFHVSVSSQQQPESFCGTTGVDPWLTEYFTNRDDFRTESFDPIYVPLTIHLTGTDQGKGHFSIETLYESLCTLNSDFEDSNIQFYIQEPINYINRTVYHNHEHFSAGIQMMQLNNVPGTANCYFVANPAGNCGYYASQGNAIALSQGCSGPNSHTWAHELGHFFSLPHTFVGWEGIRWEHGKTALDYEGQVRRVIERVERDNCTFASDGFCDTPADYLSYRWNCTGNYESNEVMYDQVVTPFRSDGSLFMSYASDGCMSRFSYEQTEAMRANLNSKRNDLVRTSFPDPNIDDKVISFGYPSDSVSIPFDNALAFWPEVPEASHYIIEVSRLPNFGFIVARERIERNEYQFEGLKPGIRYYWRVKAVNANSFCGEFSPTMVFVAAQPTATNDLFTDNEWSVLKTALYSGEPLEMRFDLPESLDAEWMVVDAMGRPLARGDWSFPRGTTWLDTPTSPSWMPGLYFIRVVYNGEQSVRRFTIIR